MSWPGADRGGDAGQDGSEGETRGGHVEAAGAAAKQIAPAPEAALRTAMARRTLSAFLERYVCVPVLP